MILRDLPCSSRYISCKIRKVSWQKTLSGAERSGNLNLLCWDNDLNSKRVAALYKIWDSISVLLDVSYSLLQFVLQEMSRYFQSSRNFPNKDFLCGLWNRKSMFCCGCITLFIHFSGRALVSCELTWTEYERRFNRSRIALLIFSSEVIARKQKHRDEGNVAQPQKIVISSS